MGYFPDATIAALRDLANLGVFFRLGTDPPLRLSFSVNDYPIELPGDEPGAVYFGAGRLINIPDLEALVNGIADTVSFTISGLDPQATALMLDSAPEVLGAPISIGIAPLNARWQPATPVGLIWSGTADLVSESMQFETDMTKNRTQSLTLTASTGDQSRQFQNLSTYSDATQKTLSPGDNFCSRVVRYTQTQIISWPRF
jgi:hypothetical protein